MAGDSSASNNLWVGNLSPSVTDNDLLGVFEKYGAINATAYASRGFGFVFFKRIEDAKNAIHNLQGFNVKGASLKIEFARPAKPCKHLWVGGISRAVSKEDLEKEFERFGKIEDFKFLRDRNTAFVEYFRLEDASEAMRNMNRKRIGGEQIRVDYLRSQPSRKEQSIDMRDNKSGQLGRSVGPNNLQFDSRYLQHSLPSGVRKDEGQPSNILWVGYPPSVQIDEQMLHNAMILFGEIERIKGFPSRHYAFVEFRSVEEAKRAKEGLQGRLFNDPRITIMFSSSELAPGPDCPEYSPAIRGPQPDMLHNENPFRPAPIDVFGPSRSMGAANFHGSLLRGPNIPMRPSGRSFEPLPPATDINDLAPNIGPGWGRLSPPVPGKRPPLDIRNNGPGAWGVYEGNQFERDRDPKRSRLDGGHFPADDRVLGVEKSYGLGPVRDGGAGQVASVRGIRGPSPINMRATVAGHGQGQVDNDCIWRGIIAKGGTPVCHGRCVAIGKGIQQELPEVINCSARTGLDMLTKHYADATGFDIVFFLPDSEDDFASYTEFLHYLGAKDRAGVAKFDDGTTLFLVPPSDFLKNVLKVAGPDRLYGVVLKFAHQLPVNDVVHQQPHHSIPSSQYSERPNIPFNRELNQIEQEKQILPVDNQYLRENLRHAPKHVFPPTSQSIDMWSTPQDSSTSTNVLLPQSGVALTPELIATLSSLAPANAQSSALETNQTVVGSSNSRHMFPASGAADKDNSLHGWRQNYSARESAGQLVQAQGSQFNPHIQAAQFHPYSSVSSSSIHSVNVAPGSTQIQDTTSIVPQQSSNYLRQPHSFAAPPQTGPIVGAPSGIQQYGVEDSSSNLKGYAVERGADASLLYNPPAFSGPSNPMISSAQGHGVNFPQAPQPAAPLTQDRVNAELPNQKQHLESALAGGSQGPSDTDADKNQRYQSTLQFAANLLMQIQRQQQQQPQTNATGGQGSGNLQ